MVRTTLFALVVGLAAVGCTDDPVTNGGGSPTNVKPDPTAVPQAQTHSFSEPADPSTGCYECTVVHVSSDDGETIKFVDPNGLEVCSMWRSPSDIVWNDTCAELEITLPVHE